MKLIYWIPLLIIALIASACDEEPQSTPTLVPPSQTPFIITATPLPVTATPTATITPTATLTATEKPADDDDDNGGSNDQGAPQPAKPINNFKPNCTARQDWQVYTITVGDTLGRLATQTDSTLNALANANCLINANIIVVGQKLRVPKQPDKGGEPDPIIEDLITAFNANQTSAVPGETITLSWTADDGTQISIINKTLDLIIGNNLGDTASLSYIIPNSVDPDKVSAMTFTISGKLVRDGEDIFASPVERTITIESPLDDCNDSGATDTADDDCETDPECDDSGATDTTDDDCETDPECDDSGATDTTDDDCETDTECDDSGATDTTDDDCETDPECDDSGATDTTDDDCETDPECDDSGATDTTDDDCEPSDDDTQDDDTTDTDTEDEGV